MNAPGSGKPLGYIVAESRLTPQTAFEEIGPLRSPCRQGAQGRHLYPASCKPGQVLAWLGSGRVESLAGTGGQRGHFALPARVFIPFCTRCHYVLPSSLLARKGQW